MRGFLVFIASGLGLGALWRRRHQSGPASVAGYPLSDEDGPDRAQELRAKLAETKVASVEDVVAEQPADEGSPLDPQSRRRDVHDRARASIDELG